MHDRLRRWPGGFAFLRRTVPLLAAGKRSRGAGPLLRANVVLMSDNVESFPALCLELAGWGFEEITWNQLGGNERPEFYAEHRLRPADVERLAKALPDLSERLAARGTRLGGGDGYLRRVAATSAGRALPVAECDVSREFLFVSLDGIVGPCSFTTAELGIAADELGSIESLPGRFQVERLRVRPRACNDCHSTQVFGKYLESR
jgi:MoaA/NifB/PqqE/SkfB family radical SAM enzyme